MTKAEEKAAEKLRAFLKKYGPLAGEDGPVLLVQEVLGAEPDEWQKDLLRAFGRGERRMSIASCHGPGKTTVAAWCIWAMLLTRFPQKTVATAPTKGQLEDGLFAEVLKWRNRLPEDVAKWFIYKGTRIEMAANPEESFLSIRTSRSESPEALQGVHSDHVLLIADEASGVPEPVFQAAQGSMAGPYRQMLLISNPVRSSGMFFDTHHKLKDRWYTKKISYKDSPRVSDDFAEDIARQHGRDSNVFRIRCLGEFPTSDDDTVIPYEYVKSAQNRDIDTSHRQKRVWGLDVARFGDDKCALVERTQRDAKVLDVWGKKGTMETSGRVKARWDDTPAHLRPELILIDEIGLGAGVVDRLKELELPVRGINVAETASAEEKFVNSRAELWWKGREWLEKKNTVLPLPVRGADEREDWSAQLAEELVIPKYEYLSSGKIKVESKSDMKKRGHKSPNIADAFILTFAQDLTTLMYGSSGSTSWGNDLRRGLSG